MLLAALFHDFGKAVPGIGKPKENDPTEFSYLGHEEESAKFADEWMKSVGIPQADRDFVCKVVALHMRSHVDSWSPRSIGRFMRECLIPGQESVPVWKYVILHGIADTLAKGTGDMEAEVFLKREHLAKFENFKAKLGKDVNAPKPLLNGFELMKMFPGLKPNRIVDKKNFIAFIGERLLDEQAAGGVDGKDDAMRYVESIRQEVESTFA
jgi:hypothetical protein